MSEVVWKREAGNGGYLMISHNGKLYTTFSQQNLYSFTPGEDDWTRVLVESDVSRYGLASLGDNIYWMGGLYAEELAIYNTVTGEISYGPNMPENFHEFTAVATDGKIYLPGGRFLDGHIVDRDTLYIYDVSAKTWSQGANMDTPRAHAATVLVDNKIYVFGGTDLTTIHKTAEVYDIASDRWAYISELPDIIERADAAFYNGKIYICGGTKDGGGTACSETWIYDIASDSYTEGPSLPEARVRVGATVLDERLYVNISGDGLYSLALEDIDEPGPGPNPGPEPEPGDGVKGCVEMEVRIKGCSNNGVMKQLCRMVADSECDCDCDCMYQ